MEEEKKSSSRKPALIVCIVVILTCFVLHYVLKSSCTGADPVHDYFILSFLPQVGNSGILFTLLWWFGAPILANMLRDRKKSIEKDIEESAQQKKAAEERCEVVRQKRGSLGGEMARLEKSYREAAEEESKRVAEDARKEAARLRRDAETAFELLSGQSLRAFEDEIRDRAIERARADIQARLASDAALRDRLIEQSIASLEI